MTMRSRRSHISNDDPQDDEEILHKYSTSRSFMTGPISVAFLISIICVLLVIIGVFISRYNSLAADFEITSGSLLQLEKDWNKFGPIFNKDRFQLEADFIPIVAYVYNRPHYFRRVLDALRSVVGIQKTMLIISHDGLNEELVRLVQDIDFCQVKQIYHPTPPTHRSSATALRDHWWWLQKFLWREMFPTRTEDVTISLKITYTCPDLFHRRGPCPFS